MGEVESHADLARLGQVTRARISQIMDLLPQLRTSRRSCCSCLALSVNGMRSASTNCAKCVPYPTGASSAGAGESWRTLHTAHRTYENRRRS